MAGGKKGSSVCRTFDSENTQTFYASVFVARLPHSSRQKLATEENLEVFPQT